MEAPKSLRPEEIIEIAIRRRWILVIPFLFAMILGIALSLELPRIYSAGTLILVEPQRVPQNYVQSIVTMDTNERITTISQQVKSRTNLEKIINEFKLFSEPKHENMLWEDKLESLRKRIAINITRARGGADAFSITFSGRDPVNVAQVSNTLASYFIDENLKVREEYAVGTSDFLQSELASMRKRLEEVEQSYKEYRERHMGELPEQLQSNLRILERYQEELKDKYGILRDLRNSLVVLQNQPQFDWSEQELLTESFTEPLEVSDVGPLQQQLEELLTRYTDKHPDVVRLKKRIDELEEKEQEAMEEIKPEGPTEDEITTPEIGFMPDFQGEEIKREIKKLESDIRNIEKQVQLYQSRIENTPKREQELLSLKRDYQNIQTTYDSLLKRKLESEIAVNMEKKQKGEQFRIIDRAKIPEKPTKPDMRKIFIMIIALGLGSGGGIVFLLEYMDNSFRKSEDIEKYLKIPVLATVPVVVQPRDKTLQKANHAAFMMTTMISLLLFVGFGALAFKGVQPTIQFFKGFIGG
jgi:polysaccharide chain length determinant protein (PEP-CTERM system associated)